MPLNVILDRGMPGQPAPLEGADETTTAGLEANAKANLMGSLGGTGIAKTMEAFGSGQHVSHDDAVAALKAQNYDPAGVPTEGMTSGALQTEMNRQSYIRINQNIADRAHLSSTSRFVSGLAGSFADPVNLALLPVGGALAGAGKSVAGRLAVGAAVGGAYSGASDVAQNALTGHSDDDLSLNSLRDILWGGVVGGGLHAAFGGVKPEVQAPRIEPTFTSDAAATLERSDAAAKRMGVSVNDVVSSTGAVGKYQIEPATAEALGFDASRLHEPAYNKMVADKVTEALNKHFANDPRGAEAAAIGYNAGPKWGDRWIKSGYDDSVLPAQTQDYVARFRKGQAPRLPAAGDISQAVDDLPPQVRENAAKTALFQFAADSPVNVEPVIDAGMTETYRTNPFKIQDEHDMEVRRLETEGMRAALPERNKTFEMPKEQLPPEPVPPKPPAEGETKGPLTQEATEHMTNAVNEAKSFATHMGEEAPAEFENKMGEAQEAMKTTEEFRKAVEAAVRCSAVKGFE